MQGRCASVRHHHNSWSDGTHKPCVQQCVNPPRTWHQCTPTGAHGAAACMLLHTTTQPALYRLRRSLVAALSPRRAQGGHMLMEPPSSYHLARRENEGRGLGLANAHDNRSKALQWHTRAACGTVRDRPAGLAEQAEAGALRLPWGCIQRCARAGQSASGPACSLSSPWPPRSATGVQFRWGGAHGSHQHLRLAKFRWELPASWPLRERLKASGRPAATPAKLSQPLRYPSMAARTGTKVSCHAVKVSWQLASLADLTVIERL